MNRREQISAVLAAFIGSVLVGGCTLPPLSGAYGSTDSGAGADTGPIGDANPSMDTAGSADGGMSSDGSAPSADFSQVAQTLRNHCANSTCHGAGTGSSTNGFVIDAGKAATDAQVYQALSGTKTKPEGTALVVAGKPQMSAIYQRLVTSNSSQKMPQTGWQKQNFKTEPDDPAKAGQERIDGIKAWIEAGAASPK